MKLARFLAGLTWLLLLAIAAPAQALGGHAYVAPADTWNFGTGVYAGTAGGASPFSTGDLVYARTGATAYAPDSAGLFHSFAAGTPRLTDRGLFVEPVAATNKMKNNSSTGAVAGTAGAYTVPTGWVNWTTLPTGLNVDLALVTDATTGFPCRRWHMYGTTSNAKSTITLTMGAAADIATSPGDIYLLSGYLRHVDGFMPADLQIYLQLRYNTSGNVLVATAGSDRLSNQDNVTKRFVTYGLAAPATTARTVPNVIIGSMNSGQAYDFTFDECAEQPEQVTTLTSNATSPILTTNAALTRGADVVTAGAPFLTALGSPTGTLELTTSGLRGRRQDHDLFTANSTVVMLRRALDGSTSAPGVTGAPATGRGYRPNWGLEQVNLVEWQPGTVRVTSTGNATIASTSNSAPAITSAALGGDGFIRVLRFWPTYQADLSRFTTVTVDEGTYGATSGAVAASVAVSRQGLRTVMVGGHHEICVGGMTGCGGLGQLDMAVVSAFNGIWIDWLRWADDQEAWVTPVTNANCTNCLNVIPEPEDMHRAIEQSVRDAGVTVLFSGGVSTCTKVGTRIKSFTTTDGITVKAKQFIDASYEGDLMVTCGVTYTYGREAADQTTDANGKNFDFDNGYLGNLGATGVNDSYNTHNFTVSIGPTTPGELLTVDPWVHATDNTSGPLYTVIADPLSPANFAADGQLQAYMFRMTVTPTAGLMTPFAWTPSADYTTKNYELEARYLLAMTNAGVTVQACCALGSSTTITSISSLLKYSTVGKSPSGGISRGTIYDINAANGESMDTFGANHGAWWASIMAACGIGSPAANYALAIGPPHYAERDCWHTFQINYQLGWWRWMQIDGALEQAALSATVAAGGSGCAVGERLTMNVANTDFPVVAKVSTISGSAVTGVIFMAGNVTVGQSLPSNPVSMTSATGTCSGATLNITWGSREPAQMVTDALTIGYVNDYYLEPYGSDPVGMPYQLYVREGVRMVGQLVAHVADLSGPDGNVLLNSLKVIGLSAYALDSHHTQTIAFNAGGGVYKAFHSGEFAVTASAVSAKGGMGPNLSAPVLLDWITPLRADATNLLVTFAVSATHAANSALRMEGVHVTTSYAAGLAAAQVANDNYAAHNDNIDIQDVDYTRLRRQEEATTNVNLRTTY